MESGKLIKKKDLHSLLEQSSSGQVNPRNPKKDLNGIENGRNSEHPRHGAGPSSEASNVCTICGTSKESRYIQMHQSQSTVTGYRREPRKFTPLPMSMPELLPQLITASNLGRTKRSS